MIKNKVDRKDFTIELHAESCAVQRFCFGSAATDHLWRVRIPVFPVNEMPVPNVTTRVIALSQNVVW